ncbi:MAG: GntR family transcriptional regulator [Mycobacterium sp.]
MPKNYGAKDKDLVVAHIVELLLAGRLRAGDRIDRNEVAKTLGVSRVPVQEAMVQLEHDGVIATQYHRGCFVQRFDESAILEHHETYGLLIAVVSERAAADLNSSIVPELERLTEALRSTTDGPSFQEAGWNYRQEVCDAYAGPRIYALVRASQAFVPPAIWAAYEHRRADLLPLYEAETDAIRRHDVEAARGASLDLSALFGAIMLEELARAGVMGKPVTPQQVSS